ncbi:MAG: hypothetical protein AAF468_20695 [Pseudomonadota bacterium]
MLDPLIGMLPGGGTLWAALAGIIALALAFLRGQKTGSRKEQLKQARRENEFHNQDRKMRREADAIDRAVAGDTREEKEKEAGRWSRN